MFGIKEKKESNGKKSLIMLVNCGYGFLGFADAEKKFAIYENKFTGQLVRFRISDATIEPIYNVRMVNSNLA